MANKIALIIGCGIYDDARLPPLSKPEADVTGLARVLSDPAIGCFDEVSTIVHGPSTVTRRAIARFFAQRSRDDTLLLYFSGHGLKDERGQLFLAARDTEEDLLSASAIPSSFITEEMDRGRSKRVILILDCCYSGAFEHGAKAGGASAGVAEAFEGNGYGRVVLTASNSTQFAWEDDEHVVSAHSTFTQFIIRGLETGEADADGDGRITVDELYDYVYERIVSEAPRQTPGKTSYKQEGEILLAQYPAAKSIQLPRELQQALKSPRAGIREGALREISSFVDGSIPALARAAKAALTAALADDSRRVAQVAAEILGEKGEPPLSPLSSGSINKTSLWQATTQAISTQELLQTGAESDGKKPKTASTISTDDAALPKTRRESQSFAETVSEQAPFEEALQERDAAESSEALPGFFGSFSEPSPSTRPKARPIVGFVTGGAIVIATIVLFLISRLDPAGKIPSNPESTALHQPAATAPASTAVDGNSVPKHATHTVPPNIEGPMRVGKGVSEPKKIYSPPPKYTQEAQKANIKGFVIVDAVINKEGGVTSATVLKGPRADLNKAALDAVQHWKFKPAVFHGKPVAVHYSFTVRFIPTPELKPDGQPVNPWEKESSNY